jgi:hypothetical protein
LSGLKGEVEVSRSHRDLDLCLVVYSVVL